MLPDSRHCSAGVNDILQNQHMTVPDTDILSEVKNGLQRRLCIDIGMNLQEIQLDRHGDRPHEIGGEKHGAAQRAEQQQRILRRHGFRIVRRNIGGKLGNPAADLIIGFQHGKLLRHGVLTFPS